MYILTCEKQVFFSSFRSFFVRSLSLLLIADDSFIIPLIISFILVYYLSPLISQSLIQQQFLSFLSSISMVYLAGCCSECNWKFLLRWPYVQIIIAMMKVIECDLRRIVCRLSRIARPARLWLMSFKLSGEAQLQEKMISVEF